MTKETTLSSIDGTIIPYVERWGGRAYEVLVYMARITPSAAGALIADERQRNRGTYGAQLTRMEGAHLRNEWRFLGDTIKLDQDGVLIDGQHRLIAGQNSGRSFDQLVVEGLPSEYFVFMDQSKPRDLQTSFKLMGVPTPSSAAPVVTLLWQLAEGMDLRAVMSVPEGQDVYLQHGSIENNLLTPHIERCGKARKAKMGVAPVGLLSYLYSRQDPNLNEIFWDGVFHNVGVTNKTDPRVKLSAHVTEQWLSHKGKRTRGTIQREEVLAWVHYTWKKFVSKSKVTNFQADKYAEESLEEIKELAATALHDVGFTSLKRAA
tara:strand:+ start:968 stop:1924 length:957 start_codon:yes stop_codon:yes gene_type:complete